MSPRSTRLFSPLELAEVSVRNRLWVSPMCQYSAVDGIPQSWHLVHLAQFAVGGAGMVIAEATAVSPEGRISLDDTGLWNHEQATAWASIASAIRAAGAVAAIQLSHAGRKASTWSLLLDRRGSVAEEDGGWETVAPSEIPFEGLATPRSLTQSEIQQIVSDFVSAAKRAVDTGFQAIEIHAAHGYLIHEFLSPLSNTRTDAYGGSLENRARLLLEVTRSIKSELPGTPVLVRFSATDWTDGGWDVSQTQSVARWTEAAGADFLDISSGGLVAHQRIPVGPAYQVALAAEVKKAVSAPVGAVGLVTHALQAESILATGQADVVLAGREWLRDPHFALRAAEELGEDLPYWPVQYGRARRLPSRTTSA